MNGKLFLLFLFFGLATALPTKSLKNLRTLKDIRSNGRLGIFDGTNTTIADHNYVVGIIVQQSLLCAGAILSESYVITAGDCAHGWTTSDIMVLAGSDDGVTGKTYRVKKIIIHQNYTSEGSNYNFALLKIRSKFEYGTNIGNVTLPSSNPKKGTPLVAVGYGGSLTVSDTADGDFGVLQEGTMKYIPEADCESYYKKDYPKLTWDSSMSCAYDKGKVTMCVYDFGNPFTKGSVLYGITAGVGGDTFCTTSAIPVILGNIYTVVDWINENIQ